MTEMFNSAYKVIGARKYNTWCRYKTRIDTYGRGCQHNCGYCYARALLEFRNNWNPARPAVSYITEIERAISGIPRAEVVRIGSMTDCLQPIERQHGVTYETIKLLNRYRINYLIVTKSCLVADDRYVEIYDRDLAHFQVSISCTDDGKAAEYESAPPPSARIRAAEKLAALGFDVSIRLSPFLSLFTDFRVLNLVRCAKVLIEFLKANHWTRKNFRYDYSGHTLKYGGHDNLQLEEKTRLVDIVSGFQQVSVGEYVRDHHNYFREHVNHNPDDCCNLSVVYAKEDAEQVALDLTPAQEGA